MANQLDKDEQALAAAEALLKGIAEHNVSPEQVSTSDVPEAVEKLFTRLFGPLIGTAN